MFFLNSFRRGLAPVDEPRSHFKDVQELADFLGVPLKTISYLVRVLDERDRYEQIILRKKSGGIRVIEAPIPPIKALQRKLIPYLVSHYTVSAIAHGYVPNRSILTNALPHIRQAWVLRVDLRNFFNSITQDRVFGILRRAPFRLSIKVATLISEICCFQGRLVQGAPTSPVLSNLACIRMDGEILALANEAGCTVTRYCDDITFSGTAGTEISGSFVRISKGKQPEIGEKLLGIFSRNSFEANEVKTRIMLRQHRQMATGLVLNQQVNVPRRTIEKLRVCLYIWRRYGEDHARERYLLVAKPHNRHRSMEPVAFRRLVLGRVQFVGQVIGWGAPTYRRLYDALREVCPECIAEQRVHQAST